MNVTLELENASHDITEYLDDDQNIELGQEHELKAFQRTVDDIRLRCSNQDGEFTTWLGSPSDVKPRIVVKDEGRTLFRGEVQQPISFDVRDEWISFDCFSMTKAFWDLCRQLKVTKATPVGHENDLWTTVQAVIEREVTVERFGHLLAGYQIASIYSARPVRFWGYTADQGIGNNGRYKDLDPRTTLDELLKAMMLYYNADIFIDPETQLLVMQKRDEVQNDVDHQLDDVIEEDEEFKVDVYDEKVDYIALTLNLGKPTAPVPRRTENAETGGGLDPGRYKWLMTFLYRSGGMVIESQIGDETDPLDFPVQRTGGRYKVFLDIPTGPTGCVTRRIYRTKNGGIGSFYLAGIVENNSDVVYVDVTANVDLQIPAPDPADGVGGTIWLRYDEQAGSWDNVIVGDASGLNAPQGEIHDVTPKLRFLAKPFGYGLEIAAIYSASGSTFVRTKGEHGFSESDWITISGTNSVPSIDGFHTVGEVQDDKLTFKIYDAFTPLVTTPGTGGTVIRYSDMSRSLSLDLTTETMSETLLDVFAFFGNEKDRLEELQSQWLNLFRSRLLVKCTAKGLAYRLGDSASLHRMYNDLTIGKCVIKRAKNNLTTERTQLELLTL